MEKETPNPAELLKEAKEAPEASAKKTSRLIDYLPVIIVLKEEKGLKYKEIADWFKDRGLDFRVGSICAAYNVKKNRS
jgi:hypothetical protein